jgi:glycolate oxidase FAD binding subunit
MAESATCLIDGFGPLPLHRPAAVEELCALVRQTAADGTAIYPLGGRTMLGLGHSPTRAGMGVDLGGLAQVIDYPARDMTITVQAGIPVAALQNRLGQENQRLPIDVPDAERATLGGAIAANVSGPRRYGFGTLRDYVIGITVVNDEGREVKAGGRVVKNVAGYDLCKLYVGSLGTLGIITQVTLKLRPQPEERALIALGCAANQVGPLLEVLHRSSTRPVCLDLLNRAALRYINRQDATVLPDAPWLVVVGYEDNRVAVSWQVQQLLLELPADVRPGLETRVGCTTASWWRALTEWPAREEAGLTFKANLLPRATADFVTRAEALGKGLALHAHAGNGIVWGHAAEVGTAEEAVLLLKPLLDWAGEEGNVVVPRCPAAWKAALPIWGKPRADAWLMRAIKQQLDPRGLFNPGRFVDGS